MPTEEPACEVCRYYNKLDSTCRRHAPVLDSEKRERAWPWVPPDEWCGDFKEDLKKVYERERRRARNDMKQLPE